MICISQKSESTQLPGVYVLEIDRWPVRWRVEDCRRCPTPNYVDGVLHDNLFRVRASGDKY